ncbi:MAG TPA: hypothetical protein VF189_02525 [Patescibacteria group bacterium]
MKKYIPQLFVLGVITYLLFIIRPALFGQLGGTFKSHQVPNDYNNFEVLLSSQKDFSRTFWIPSTQRFGFYSALHPAVSSQDFYHVASLSGVMDFLKKPNAERLLQDSSVKYVIVPFDSEEELFLKDRKYDEATYEKTVAQVKKISWLKEMSGFGKIHVFELSNSKGHFWTKDNSQISYKEINPTEYVVNLKNAKKGDLLIFSESYDNGWIASIKNLKPKTENSKNSTISSTNYENILNSFVLSQNGDYMVKVFYQPQEWVNIGLWVSGITFTLVVFCLLIFGHSWFGKRKMVQL